MKKNILMFLSLLFTVMMLSACGNGGGSDTIVVTFTAGANGTITGTPSQAVVSGGSTTAVTAVPALGYQFVNWTGTNGFVTTTANSLIVNNVTVGQVITANFAISNTTAILKIKLTGPSPATAISGAGFKLTLPDNVTPALTGADVATGVVVLTGTFAGGTQTPPVYAPATPGIKGTLLISLASNLPAGVTTVGEIATITLQRPSNAALVPADFVISGVSVVDIGGNPIAGMGALVDSVTVQ